MRLYLLRSREMWKGGGTALGARGPPEGGEAGRKEPRSP